MALQFSALVRNAMLNAIETTVGTAAVLKIWTGAPPATPETADSGTLLASMTLESDWMAAASAGSKALAGAWADSSANASGDAGHFRLYYSGGTCGAQGTITATGGGGDMTLDSIAIVSTQSVTITTFTLTAGNA